MVPLLLPTGQTVLGWVPLLGFSVSYALTGSLAFGFIIASSSILIGACFFASVNMEVGVPNKRGHRHTVHSRSPSLFFFTGCTWRGCVFGHFDTAPDCTKRGHRAERCRSASLRNKFSELFDGANKGIRGFVFGARCDDTRTDEHWPRF